MKLCEGFNKISRLEKNYNFTGVNSYIYFVKDLGLSKRKLLKKVLKVYFESFVQPKTN